MQKLISFYVFGKPVPQLSQQALSSVDEKCILITKEYYRRLLQVVTSCTIHKSSRVQLDSARVVAGPHENDEFTKRRDCYMFI